MRTLALFAFATLAAASQASFTVATFDDPTTSSAEVMFTFDSNNMTLQGSYGGTNLNLVHPGFTGGGSTSGVTFSSSIVNLTPIASNVYQMGAGVIQFLDSSSSLIFTISFSGGLFVNPFSASSADISGFNVTFSGPNVPSGLSDEQFSFSLANAVNTGGVWTYTSAFTSSAVPEPATMVALGSGLALLAARRRSRK
jgi:hypothetical protein